MCEHSIRFKDFEVRAILNGSKTQTRRPVKRDLANAFDPPRGPKDVAAGYPWFEDGDGNWYKAVDCCPYGKPGDHLWVRETWAIRDCGRRVGITAETWSDGFPVELLQYPATDDAPWHDESGKGYWWNQRSSIHMPRWACRIVLEIVSVRVERLEDITIADAQAEGFDGHGGIIPFIQTWERIYGNRGHGCDAKPWVWVIEFKRVEVPA